MHTRLTVVLFILFFSLFFLKSLALDPDLGWHLATGTYVMSYGFPQTDPFSFSMPSYPVIFYAWLTDILLASFYKVVGIHGLAFLVAAVASGSLWLLLPKSKKNHSVIPLLLCGSTLLFVMGIRAQVFTWLLFALLLIILKKENKQKYITLPIIFLLWANMHGSFILGLGVVTLHCILAIYKRKKNYLHDITAGGIAFLVTFINPYGIRLWEETFRIIFWTEKHFLLLDWFPGIFVPYIPLWIIFFLSMFFLYKFANRYTLFEKIGFIVLFSVAMSAIIDIPYFTIFAFPILLKGYNYYLAEPKTEKKLFLSSRHFLSVVCLVIFLQGIFLFYAKPYPENAVRYLRSQNIQGNIFADFNWGGYVLWALPDKKIFIDGQMTHWKQKNTHVGESENAFQEYLRIASRKESIAKFTTKYHIDTLVLPPGFGDLHISNGAKLYPAVSRQLLKGGWEIVYKDEIAIVYRKISK